MGSAASTKKTVNRKVSSVNEGNVERPTEDRHSQPLTIVASALLGQDESDGTRTKQNLVTTCTPLEHTETHHAGILKENKSDGTSRTLSDTSDGQMIDTAAAKAKRIEEFSDEVKRSLDMIKGVTNHVLNCKNYPCTKCLNNVEKINRLRRNKAIDPNSLSEGVAIDTEYCKMFAYAWRKQEVLHNIDDVLSDDDDRTEARNTYKFYNQILSSALNFSDESDAFCVQMEQDECLSLVVDWLLFHHESNETMNTWREKMSLDVMSILENACRRVPSISPKHHRVVPVLQKFGESEDIVTQMCAFTLLAKLVRKEEADKLSTNYACMVLLLTLLEKCHLKSNHKVSTTSSRLSSSFTIPAIEILQSLEELATNDKNKSLIVEKGGIPILRKFLKTDCSDEEKTYAANAIWRLAFLKENKVQLRKDQDIIYNLTENSQSESEKLRNACMGALFEIYESRLPEGLTGKKADNGSPQRAPSNSVKSCGHIMLSYKWEHPSKPVMREFKKQLRSRGYTVWMDEDHMMGDKIGAMADAVENADMIIACITRGYQDSQDCRTEASYAYECKKKIIPIKVGDFKPTSWLGGITAGKIYYTVPGADHVNSVLPSIIEKEFAVQRDEVQVVNATPGPTPSKPKPKPTVVESQVPGWDSKKVQDWLAANNVTTRHKGLTNLNGTQLLQLKKQLATAPQTFYQYVVENLKVPYLDVLSLAAALENLN